MRPSPWRRTAARRAGFGDPSTDLQTYVQGQANTAVQQGQQQLNNLQGQAATVWSQAQAKVASAGYVTKGAQAAEKLLQNGYNPDNQADNQALVQAIAAGLALIPGVGLVLAAALEALDAAAYAIAAVLVNAGFIPKPMCTSTGGWTANQALIAANGQPYVISAASVPGSFATLALAALQKNWLDKMNCLPAYSAPTLVAGLAQLWNQQVNGPAQLIWIPYTNDTGFWPLFSPYLGGGNAGAAGNAGNAFNPPTDDQLANYAFMPLSQAAAAGMAPYGFEVAINQGTFTAPSNAGTIVKNIAIGTLAVGGLGAAALGVYAHVTGQTIMAAASGLFKGVASSVDESAETAAEVATSETSVAEEAKTHRRSSHVQSLLFSKRAGWTPASARDWAWSHGYRSGKTHETADHIRLRQFPPEEGLRYRTVTFGRGISAVIAA